MEASTAKSSINLVGNSFRNNLDSAIKQWSVLLGASSVLVEDESLQHYGSDCGLKEVLPRAVVVPDCFDNLRQALIIANENSVPVYPSSKGKNWGYGSTAPTSQDCVVFDLSKLNKIIEVNEELAFAVIEPGVTQQQLHDYIEANHPSLCMDVTGATPESSLIGNLTERGYGQTPYGDRFQNSAGMEVVLANGSVIKTGFWHFEKSRSHHLYKWGIGPYLDGLFTQSNFGIVTKVGLWLMPKPAECGLLLIEMNSDSQVSKVTAKLRDLKLRGLLPATVHISNDIRILSCFDQFPYDLESGESSLSEKSRIGLRKKWGVAAWTCFTSLRGSKGEVKAALGEIKKALRGEARVDFISSTSVKRARSFGSIYSLITGRSVQKTEQLFKLVSGKPSYGPSLGAFWRSKSKPTDMKKPDPIGSSAGIVWCAPVIPATVSAIQEFLELIDGCMKTFGFESNITLTMLSERALCCTVAITFDHSTDEQRARNCYKAVLDSCVARGFIPYRHGINVEDGKQNLFQRNDPFWALCQKLKGVLDERHILSPNKYGIQ